MIKILQKQQDFLYLLGMNSSKNTYVDQEGHPIAVFSEKLNEAKQKYAIYDKELCCGSSFALLASLSPSKGVHFIF